MEKKMKKLLLSTFALSFLILSSGGAQAGVICQQIGNITFCNQNVGYDYDPSDVYGQKNPYASSLNQLYEYIDNWM
jgi:hypothetical protein